jgi:hypothetical protein
MYSPDIYEALGYSKTSLPNATDGRLVFPKNYKALDLSPGIGRVSIGGHSDIVANQPLIDFLWERLLTAPKD